MKTFEPTAKWLRAAADEVEAAGNKWSVGFSAPMLRQIAEKLSPTPPKEPPSDPAPDSHPRTTDRP